MLAFWEKHKIGVVVAVGLIVALLIGVISLYAKTNSLRNEAIKQETGLVAQYDVNRTELSKFILQFKESLGIADRSAEKLEGILIEAVKGRYDGNMEPGTSGSMFSAITEAYPDLTATTEAYQKVQDLVMVGREAYQNQQALLIDKIREYDRWRNSDYVNVTIINWIGVPTKVLTINAQQDGKQVTLTGEEALNEMRKLVLVQEANDAYDTGVMEPLITPDE